MDPQVVVDIGRETVQTVLLLGAPVLVVAAVVGIVVGLLQAVTQIHDPTVLFVARLLAVVVVLGFCLPWLVEHYTQYSREAWQQIPETIFSRDRS
jgi:flagellar biosynthetic protein FliQ